MTFTLPYRIYLQWYKNGQFPIPIVSCNIYLSSLTSLSLSQLTEEFLFCSYRAFKSATIYTAILNYLALTLYMSTIPSTFHCILVGIQYLHVEFVGCFLLANILYKSGNHK